MVLSWPLFFEFGAYLRHFFFFRWMSFISALVYNTIYFALLASWLIEIYTLPDDTELGTMDLLLDMFFIYNTILHSTIIPLNTGIIIKEVELQFYELLKKAGGKGSNYNLSFERAHDKINDRLWIFDPPRLLDHIRKKLMKII